MCHKFDVSYTQRQIGINSLIAFIAKPEDQTLTGFSRSSVDDVACYFPEFSIDCEHCRENTFEKDFVRIAKLFLSQDTDEVERTRVFKQVRALRRANSSIAWAFLIQGILLEYKFEELRGLGDFFYSGVVPAEIARAFGIPRFEVCKKLLEVTTGWDKLEFDIGKQGLARISEIRATLEDCMSLPIASLTMKLDQIPSKYFGLITERVLALNSNSELELWIESLEAGGHLRPRDYSEVMERWAVEKLTLSQTLKDKILQEFANGPRREFYFKSILHYSLRLADENFCLDAVKILDSSPAFASAAEIQHFYEFFLKTNWFKPLNLLESNQVLLSKVDFQTLDWLSERSILKPMLKSSIKKIAFAVRGQSSTADFLALVKAYLGVTSEISRKSQVDLYNANKRFLATGPTKLGPRQIEGVRLLCLSTSINHPEIYALAKESFQRALGSGSIKFIEALSAELTSQKATSENLQNILSRFRPDNGSAALLPIKHSVFEPQTNFRVNLYSEYFLALVRREIAIPSLTFESFLVRLCSQLNHDQIREVITALVHLPGGLRINELNGVATTLLRTEGSQENALTVVDILEANQIPLSEYLKHQIFTFRSESGDLFEWGIVEGPQAQYWNQLAIIFDDVVHEINQPLLALGLNIRMLSKLASKFGEEISAISSALEMAQSELATRMIHYQALTNEGTQTSWLDLDEILSGVVHDLETQAVASKVKLVFDNSRLWEPAFVAGPSFQFKTAIRNLVRNAIASFDSSAKNRLVKVSVFRIRGLSDQVVVSVDDTGSGIPESEQEKIFERGYTTKKGRGLGLGLSLSASVINAMGGALKLDKTSSAGSSFLIVLPARSSLARHEDTPFELEAFEVSDNEIEQDLELEIGDETN
jgi:signal transduction histidine kinase